MAATYQLRLIPPLNLWRSENADSLKKGLPVRCSKCGCTLDSGSVNLLAAFDIKRTHTHIHTLG